MRTCWVMLRCGCCPRRWLWCRSFWLFRRARRTRRFCRAAVVSLKPWVPVSLLQGTWPGPSSERGSSLPPLSHTPGFAAVSALPNGSVTSGSAFPSGRPGAMRPAAVDSILDEGTPRSPGGSALVPRTAEAERKDWQSQFLDRRV